MPLLYKSVAVCLTLLILQISVAQSNPYLTAIAKDTAAFSRFADSCIKYNAGDYLMESYKKMIEDGKQNAPFTSAFFRAAFYEDGYKQAIFKQLLYLHLCGPDSNQVPLGRK